MVHGLPDGTLWGKGVTVHDVFDVGELAARLGGPSVFERRGNMVWYDDFEDGLGKWLSAGVPVTWSAKLFSTAPDTGSYALRLAAKDEDNAYMYILHYHNYLNPGKLGVELALSLGYGGGRVRINFYIFDGTEATEARIQYSSDTDLLELRDENGDYQTIAENISPAALIGLFHKWKLVIDSENQKYVRFFWGTNEYDISAYSCRTYASSAAPVMAVYVYLYKRTGYTPVVILDNIILTQNE